MQRFGRFDVAVARFRRCGHDAEGHQPAGLRFRAPGVDGGAEVGGITDHMVGGEHQQQRVLTTGCGLECGDGHGRSRVAPHGLQQDRAGLLADLAHLLGHDEAVVVVADQQGRRQVVESLQPLLGLL